MTDDAERGKVQQAVLRELARWRPGGDDLDVALFRDFARAVIERLRGPFLAQHPVRHVLRTLETAFRFALVRPPDAIRAEVRAGAGERGVQLLALLDDQPFVLDTLRLFLKRGQADYWGGFALVYRCARDADGRLVAVYDDAPTAEAIALFDADEGTLAADLEGASARLTLALLLARVAVRDFPRMTDAVRRWRARARAIADRGGAYEDAYGRTADFLDWLLEENFVFLGVQGPEGALGIDSVDSAFRGTTDGVWVEPHPPGTVLVRKSQQESPVHREGRIDEILVVLDPGAPRADALLVRGMFTYRGITHPSRDIPILRDVVAALQAGQEALPGSYAYKGIANVFDALPTEFLFTTPRFAIAQMIDLVLESEVQQDVGVTLLRNVDGSAFCLVCMPKTFYADELRRDIESEIRRALAPSHADHGLYAGRYDMLLLHWNLTGLGEPDDATVEALLERIRTLATPWANRLWAAVADRHGEARADALVDAYGRAFPDAYTRGTPVDRALRDLEHLDALSSAHAVLADLFVDADDRVVLRVYQTHDVFLTEIVPVLDDLGLTIRSSDVVPVATAGVPKQFDSFVLEVRPEEREALLAHREVVLAALPAVFDGLVESDRLNALIVSAGLTWRQVDVLRAYTRYMRQLQVPVSPQQVQAILCAAPELCRRLVEQFEAAFDPGRAEGREAAVAAARERAADLLRRIHAHEEDLVFGGLANLIDATLRTNAWRTDREGHCLAFKLDCARVRDMRSPKPLFEIYVHARDVEGVHLRFGRVARGGLRWSDRADYRTEILGLATTQQVKNVVIVPEGAKGGFFVRRPAKDPAGRRAQADQVYRVFVSALLDLTDNVVAGVGVRPTDVVCLDPEDPYLVVAADKGTAHLSDTANALSEARGFWLGDAFASGGSQGYDHKEVGITARGAWVLAKRHFAELGRDPYTQPFTCVGVGDMGGDVFGNGLIETAQTRLVAAFNHVHVFLDPDPDPAVSHAERKRLFEAGGREGGWDRYDPAKISAGGGVYERGAKSIPLSPQAAALLGLEGAEASPEEVIRAVLRLDVDLIWMGGIGNYVKASTETHADVDDRTNDRFRVDARELRCKVIAEGANLGMTQRARTEACLHGVRLNADFIDNSGGVDLSDHEVNLKILLRGPVERGELTVDARNALLHGMTDEVATLVLADNDIQGRQISRDRIRSTQDIFPFGRAIDFLERHFGVDRRDLGLPTTDELALRAAQGHGLARSELAVISAWVKRYVYAELVGSGRAKELVGYGDLLTGYFPAPIRERWQADIAAHQLADEIAMTVVTTRIVGDAGAAFVPLVVESTGRGVFDIADAYLRAQRLARAPQTRRVLEELRTSVGLHALYQAWVDVDAGCRDVTTTWLAPGNAVPTDAQIERMAEAAEEVYALQADEVVRRNASRVAEMRAADIPEDVARLVVKARYLPIALMVWWHAERLGASFHDVVVRQLAAGRASRLQEIVDELHGRPASGEWEPIAVQILADRLVRLLRDLVLRLGPAGDGATVDELEPRLAAGPLADVRRQVDTMLPKGARADLATLLVLEERLAGAIGRLGEG